MKVFLMYPDRDFDPGAALPDNEPDLAADLELDTLLSAMAVTSTCTPSPDRASTPG